MKKLMLALMALFGVVSVIFGIIFTVSLIFTCVKKTGACIDSAKSKIKETVIEHL